MARAWLRDPTFQAPDDRAEDARERGHWNGEFYVSFGDDEHRSWDDARKFGFVSAGGGDWYTRTLKLLTPGCRAWVNVPGRGYVGVGKILGPPIPIESFMVSEGSRASQLLDAKHEADYRTEASRPGLGEQMVPVEWSHTVPVEEAVHERGFFGNQNTVAQPRSQKWSHTVQRLQQKWNVPP